MEDSHSSTSIGNSFHGSQNVLKHTRSESDKENYDPEHKSTRSAYGKAFGIPSPTTKPLIKRTFASTTPPPSRPAPLQQRDRNILFEAPQTLIDEMEAKSKKIVESYNVFSVSGLGYQTRRTAFKGTGSVGEKENGFVSALQDSMGRMGNTSSCQTATSSVEYQLRPSLKVNRRIFDSAPTCPTRHATAPSVGTKLQRSNSVELSSSPSAEGVGEHDSASMQNNVESGTPLKGRKRGRRKMEAQYLVKKEEEETTAEELGEMMTF